MKASLKKQIEILTNNNYIVIFEAKENLANKWVYYIIHNGKDNMYYAGFHTNKEISINDFTPFETYKGALDYLGIVFSRTIL